MKRVSTLFSLLLMVVILNGQYDPRENFYDAEFFYAEEDYTEALYAYTKVYNEGYEDNSNINYRIGSCLLQIEGKKVEAIPYLEKATENIAEKRYREGSFKEENAPADAYLQLANAYRINNQFDEAIQNYRKFLEYEGDDTTPAIYAKLQIQACENAKEEISNREQYKVGTLGQINMIRAPVYNPVVSGDLNTFAFMGKQKFYNGVYVSRKQDGKWSKPYNITPSIQSDGNQNVLSLSHDGNTMLLTWADQFESDIYMSEYKNGRWYRSEPLPKPINSKYYESHACFTPDGNAIYFTSNRNESLGGMDIFKCQKNTDGTWSDVILLGENVNTVLNEENPFVSSDGKRLYFSSQGHSGMGGFDIFYCDILDDNTYGEPINLNYPLNTADDDLAFTPKKIEFDGYLAMYSKGEAGEVDVYRFEWIPESAQPVIVAFEQAEEDVEELTEVIEEATEETGEVIEEVTDEVTEIIEKTTEVAEEAIEEEVVETYLVKPVFFGFDSFELSENAIDKLNGLAAILNRFPTLQIEIIGHTDAIGNEDYNKQLAKKRAIAVADYLQSEGVDNNRLTTMSKGETDPVAINRTAENSDAPKGRELNRRVHFKVSVPNGIVIELEDINVPEELKIK